MKFVDVASVTVRSGDGGSGVISFRREKYIPFGGPDGGNGGRGGDVLVRVNRHLTTLLDFRYRRHYRAENGGHGSGARKTGRSGASTVLQVPAGTIVRDAETGTIIADLTAEGDEIIVAHGGRGGRGNAEFATSVNQAPRRYEPGGDGEERHIELELKLLADVGLIGLPNAGKSTLISVISAARPKIADYPFTTLVPNLGIVRVAEGKSLVVADIPGLIEGAHQGKGLGIQFLRHIERTKVLLFLLDAAQGSPADDYRTLAHELESYNPRLLETPRLIALTKMDALGTREQRGVAGLRFPRVKVHRISAVAGTGIRDLVAELWQMVRGEQAAPATPTRKRAARLPARRTRTRSRSR